MNESGMFESSQLSQMSQSRSDNSGGSQLSQVCEAPCLLSSVHHESQNQMMLVSLCQTVNTVKLSFIMCKYSPFNIYIADQSHTSKVHLKSSDCIALFNCI